MKNNKILVTGGAGYIGSHVVRQLGAAGEDVITLDNLSTGFEAAVTAGELIVGDTGDADLLEKIFSEHEIDTIMHFAAHTIVPESVADPLKYYGNNTASSRTLLEAAARHGVRNIVFSSTAAVYGVPAGGKASEDSPTQPINPYGTSKLMTEWMLRDLAAVENANGEKLNIREEPRRAGDPPELVAVADRVRDVLGWTPKLDDLDTIVHTSLEWERKIASQDPSAYWAD